MKIREKLMAIQSELKAPKGQYNSYGKYNYRSCEDILEAVKPLLAKYKCTLTIHDDIALVGERYYIKATASLLDTESPESIGNVAYARESLDKKGMDDMQITGTASSYARKYCLNGLFLIDDTKDADVEESEEESNEKPAEQKKEKKASPKQMELCQSLAKDRESKCELLRLIIVSMGSTPDEEWISGADDSKIKKFIEEYIPNLSLDSATKFIEEHKEGK